MEPGTRLGHYEILDPLGAGGMGEVYRARDTNLKREVAIKVLPEAVTKDATLLARLEREAHLLASLNHPNIATIFSLEQDADIRFLVLELIDGVTLADELERGPLGVEEALETARQIAEALESAHGKGVIHRNLKSGNVMVTTDGQIKVLDFGIAKAFQVGPTDAQSTVEAPLTATGMLVGTMPYMSPEQVRGEGLDARVDIWSFGCLLYEALTATRPFDRETAADTLGAIL